ncbi:3-phosphoshikimate 1-carboxyvinyltransferase, partial [Amycolatopsis magusensis]|nr:3-phosphoshikimate 1-carboxyvinyltransferase [Amycolatopsis magusensis]
MAEAETWTAPESSRPLDATVRVPGSKSLTNRAYVLAALATGPTLVREPLVSRDTRLMLGAVSALGGGCTETAEGTLIRPIEAGSGDATVTMGNAGTVARFTPALAALGNRTVHFDGDEALRRRPLAPLLDALSALGAE